MAITTYAELKTAVYNWTHRADLANYVDDIITIGEKWIFRKARTRDMETAFSVSIGTTTSVPADFVEIKHAYISGTPIIPLEVQSPEYIQSRYTDRVGTGTARFIAVVGDGFIFGPNINTGTLYGTYYKRLTVVSSSANALFTKNPDLYLFAALAETQAFIKDDERVALWTAKRDQILADVNAEDKQSRSGTAMRVIAE